MYTTYVVEPTRLGQSVNLRPQAFAAFPSRATADIEVTALVRFRRGLRHLRGQPILAYGRTVEQSAV